jgi:hypothetical protein
VYGAVVDGDGERGKYARTISVQHVHIEAIRDVMGYDEGRKDGEKSRKLEKELHVGDVLSF